MVIDVSHSLKLAAGGISFDCGFFISELSSSQSSSLSNWEVAGLNLGYIFSIICSNSGRKLAERWQFWRMIHPPCFLVASI